MERTARIVTAGNCRVDLKGLDAFTGPVTALTDIFLEITPCSISSCVAV
jgi:hypothetical protein